MSTNEYGAKRDERKLEGNSQCKRWVYKCPKQCSGTARNNGMGWRRRRHA